MEEALLDVEEAARRLGGVSKWTVYSWFTQGRLRRTKVGSRVMVRTSDLAEFVKRSNPKEESQE